MPRPLLRIAHALLGHPNEQVLIQNHWLYVCQACGKTKDRRKRRMAL
jgi:hypothetical protein